MRKKILNKKTLVIFSIVVAALFIGVSMNPAMAKMAKREKRDDLRSFVNEPNIPEPPTGPEPEYEIENQDSEKPTNQGEEEQDADLTSVSQEEQDADLTSVSQEEVTDSAMVDSSEEVKKEISLAELADVLETSESEIEMLLEDFDYQESITSYQQTINIHSELSEKQKNNLAANTASKLEEKDIAIEDIGTIVQEYDSIKGYDFETPESSEMPKAISMQETATVIDPEDQWGNIDSDEIENKQLDVLWVQDPDTGEWLKITGAILLLFFILFASGIVATMFEALIAASSGVIGGYILFSGFFG